MHMRNHSATKTLAKAACAIAAAAALTGNAAPAHAAFATVEFSENGTLANLTNLAGSEAFAAQGLHFTGSAEYVIDSRLIGAGTDDKGITTGLTSPIMGVTFDSKVSSVSFDALSVNTEFFATVFNSNNTILDTFNVAAAPGNNYISHTFTGVGDIARIEFHDNSNFIAVGRLSFTPVPEPATLALAGVGVGALSLRRRRR